MNSTTSETPSATDRWSILEHLFDAIAVVDKSLNLLYANERFRILANLPIDREQFKIRVSQSPGAQRIDRLLEVPPSIWQTVGNPNLRERPIHDSTSFSFSSGARGFAQLMMESLGLQGGTEHFLISLRDITLELQNKWRLSENEKVIAGLKRNHAESQFLWRLSLETPIYIEPSVVLTAIARRLRDELEFLDASFMRLGDSADSVPEPLLTDNRVGSRLREVAMHTAPKIRASQARSEIWSLEYQDMGIFWILTFKPKNERAFFLITRSSPLSLDTNRRSFLEPLGLQILAWHENRSMYLTSITDKLTGLSNRRQFDSRFAIECVLARERKMALSLILLDIDNFKKINDSFGHLLGDTVLRVVGSALHEKVRSTDVTARVGGEEFAVILHDTSAKDAFFVAEKIRAAIAAIDVPIQDFDKGIRVTVSCGIAEFDTERLAPENIYAAADEALYKAKNSGRNCSVVFSPVS